MLPSRSIYILDARGRKRIQPCSQSLAIELHHNRCRSNKTKRPHEAARQRHRRARALQATEADPEITSINKLERDTLALKMLLISGYPLPVYRGAIAGFIPLVPKPVFCVAICKNPKIGGGENCVTLLLFVQLQKTGVQEAFRTDLPLQACVVGAE